jgi:nicotinamidase-related amidase
MVSRLAIENSFMLVVDMQAALASSIVGMDRIAGRAQFLLKVAKLLGIPVVATEQNPTKMGATVEPIASMLESRHAKTSFSALGCPECLAEIERLGRKQVIVLGIETHICVSQSVRDLKERNFEAIVCGDAVSSRSTDRHELGLERIRQYEAAIGHTEAVAYEWMGSSDHPRFREVLSVVKQHPPMA